MNSSSSIQIPDSVEKAVATLLAPYGLNARKLIAKAKEQETMPDLSPRYVTIAQAKNCVNVSRWAIWRAAKDGKLRTVKPGGRTTRQGRVLVDFASLLRWVEGKQDEN